MVGDKGFAGQIGRRCFAIVLGALLALPAVAPARQAPKQPSNAKPYFDSRSAERAEAARANTTVAAARPSRRTNVARAQLRRELGAQGVLSIDPLTGTPRQLLRTDGALSQSRGGDRVTIAREYLSANRAALGLDAADLDKLSVYRQASTKRGMTLVHLRQVYAGIPAFDNDVRVAIDRAGRVISVAGSPRHDLAVASTDPQLSASEALKRLQRNVGVERAITVRSGPDGARHVTRFASGDVARLVLFGAASGARLAWHITYRATANATYAAVVDASSGAILLRQNLVKDAASALVYPNHPGAGAPQSVDLEDYGLEPGATVLDGLYARTWSDINDDDEISPGEDIPNSAGTNFIYPFTPFGSSVPALAAGCMDGTRPCAWDPADRDSWLTNRKQNGTQAFYLAGRFAQHLAGDEVLFTDDWGSFEVGGTGGDDPVELNADDGANSEGDGGPDSAHVNNANMSTPPDGESPRMQMYLMEDSATDGLDFRNVNTGDDSGVLWHEFTHGLSNRLVIDADGVGALNSPHSAAMGEAWSDWYASDLQVRDGLKSDSLGTPGEINIGDYTDLDFGVLRTEALDCPVGAVDELCPGGAATAVGGYTLGDFGKVAGVPEVHADGEIWAQTLWDLRQALGVKVGSAGVGSDLALILVSDGMRVSPVEPSMLDMRNAILAADEFDFGGALHEVVWDVFRNRGMGYFAAVIDGGDTAPEEDFSAPPEPGGPTGTVTGIVTDGDSGLPLEGVRVGLGGHTTPNVGELLADETGADGRYEIEGVPTGTYPKLAFLPSAGFDPFVARDVVVTTDDTTTRNAAMRRDWAAIGGGAEIEEASDDTGGPFGCGVDRVFDQAPGSAWSAFNPTSEDPDNPHAGPPTVTLQLPETIDVSTFLLDPSAGCGDGASSTTREYTLETSSDGTTFQIAVDGRGANGFTDGAIAHFNQRDPAGSTGQNVRYIRLTMLNPLRQGDDCAPNACSGTDFIDFSELVVRGGTPNELPSGSLAADRTSAQQGMPVTFTASFSDSDSAITGYDWDFDGNGTVDRSTDGPFTARVAAKDFRGGSGTATRPITVTAPPPPPPGPPGPPGTPGTPGTPPGTTPTPLPTVLLSRRGTRQVTFDVTCRRRCDVLGKLTVSLSLAKRLGLPRGTYTLRKVERRVTSTNKQRFTLRLTAKQVSAARRLGLSRIEATLTVRATYLNGRRSGDRRPVNIKL
jgi:extracellular elastinolytic metalloproteinase